MSTNSSSLSSLVHCGKALSRLLHQNAKIRGGFVRRTIGSGHKTEISIYGDLHQQVNQSIDKLLQDLKGAPQGSIAQESIFNVIDITEGLLQKLIEADKSHAKSYQEIADRVRNFKISQGHRSSTVVLPSSPDDSSQHDEPSSSTSTLPEEFDDVEHKFNDLTNDEKRCLFYFSLFPEGAELKKRELIFWWIGMMSLTWLSHGGEAVGEEILAKLVLEGFIDRLNNSSSNRYRMRASVRSKVMDHAAKDLLMHCVGHESTQQGRSFSMHYVGKKSDEAKPNPQSIEALLNIGVHDFNAATLEWLSKVKNAFVLHLGSWRANHHHHNDPGYIVVDDTEPLEKALKQLGDQGERGVRFLSLQGISGILELPEAVYKLQNLVVLDLRACNNLESLPNGIGSLKQLTYLDMSECYLLEHIPTGIALLSNLRVLKGFIISQDSDPQVRIVGKNVSSCAFRDLSRLKKLTKLTIRSRRMDFPRRVDLETLCEMEELKTLGIAWVERSSEAETDNFGIFPELIKKLELQAAPESIASWLLELISNKQYCRLEKLYIRGALGKLELHTHQFHHIKQVRLRYLPELHMDRNQFMHSFPNCTRLEIFGCPNLNSLPCDKNGVWERKVEE